MGIGNGCRQTNMSLDMGGNVEVEVVLGRFSKSLSQSCLFLFYRRGPAVVGSSIPQNTLKLISSQASILIEFGVANRGNPIEQVLRHQCTLGASVHDVLFHEFKGLCKRTKF